MRTKIAAALGMEDLKETAAPIPYCPMPLGCSQCPDSGPTASLAADEDLGAAPRAGGAVSCLAAEGGPGLLCADLRLPHQHMALAEEMTSVP